MFLFPPGPFCARKKKDTASRHTQLLGPLPRYSSSSHPTLLQRLSVLDFLPTLHDQYLEPACPVTREM
jgi:hypothetical protein